MSLKINRSTTPSHLHFLCSPTKQPHDTRIPTHSDNVTSILTVTNSRYNIPLTVHSWIACDTP